MHLRARASWPSRSTRSRTLRTMPRRGHREPSQAARSLRAGDQTTEKMESTEMSNFAINRVVLVGRLTRDPEVRALPSGTSVCGLRIACNSSRKDADGALVEKPNYFDVSVYGAAAESVSNYMHRGSRVGVDGRLEWREWETAEH